MSATDALTIGAVAAKAGVHPSAIRYYERAGLLEHGPRTNGRRIYDETIFESLALIDLAQDAGFTVAEIKVLMSGFEQGTPASQRWRTLAARKRDELALRIARAEQMRGVLERLGRCECRTLSECVRTRKAAMIATNPVSGT
jgi:MerR family redox-sensitive transcriptional activator SoxR